MSKEISEKLREFIDYHQSNDGYLHDDAIDTLCKIVIDDKEESEHVGYKASRCDSNPREKAFAEQWRHENRKVAGLNFGQGTLQDLFYEYKIFPDSHKCVEFINERDRYIVATVIQWLGTNCGMAFLSETLRKVNMSIVTNKEPQP